MSAAQEQSPQHRTFEDAIRESMAATISLLMSVRGVPNRKALAAALAPYGMSQSTLYSRLNRSTDWQASELAALGAELQVPPAVFFAPPEVEIIAPMIGMSTEEVVKALVSRAQNWKQMMGSDQPERPNMVLAVSRKRAATPVTQPQLPMLTLVRD